MYEKSALTYSISLILFVTLLLSLAVVAADETQAGRNVGGGEMGIDAIIHDAQPISSDQVMSEGHMEYSRGMICAECHEVTFDMVTTSTKQFTNNFPQLSNDDIWEKIEAFLPGRERFALTTSYDGMPTASTVDMVLDKEQKVLFVVAEKGTEKLLHIQQNPECQCGAFQGLDGCRWRQEGMAQYADQGDGEYHQERRSSVRRVPR